MTPQELNKMVDQLMSRFDEVNSFYVAKVARQIEKIGKLNQSSINRLTIMAEMNEDISAINQQLAQAARLSIPQLYSIYNEALNDTYTDPRFARALTMQPLSETAKARLEGYARAVSAQTAGSMVNLSNTTIASDVYRQTVDKAVLAVSSGLDDYKSATREAIRELGYGGLQVRYPTGYHRRLDTAVRQNIIDGANQIAQNASIIMGDDLGFDAYELSAHARSAPDHEPIQGRVFLREEFAKLQNEEPFQDVDGHHYDAIRRSIGEWNCMHIAMSFSTQYSVRRYTDQQLAQWAADNAKGCEIDGKHYSTYEAVQLMRRLETAVRREKDVANAARLAGDEQLRKDCQLKINALAKRYSDVARIAKIKPRKDRMQVEGFQMVKV